MLLLRKYLLWGNKCMVMFQDYEVRLYPKTSWMSTNLKGVSYKSATSEMFMKLFKYIQGRNEKSKQITLLEFDAFCVIFHIYHTGWFSNGFIPYLDTRRCC